MRTIPPGVYAITATPFDEDGRLDEESLGSLVEFEIRAGVHGLVILGIMGESHKLADRERLRVTQGVLGGVYFHEELLRGADGTMTGFAFPEILVGIYERFRAGRRAEAAALFDRYASLIRYEGQPGVGLAIRKEILRRRGAIRCAGVRSPGSVLDEDTARELDGVLERMGIEAGPAPVRLGDTP
jgi:dihydrodipicolinate synthase/N-acetylneuraminate lyase